MPTDHSAVVLSAVVVGIITAVFVYTLKSKHGSDRLSFARQKTKDRLGQV
jgi:ABC-type enterobactin transport system permease subunit